MDELDEVFGGLQPEAQGVPVRKQHFDGLDAKQRWRRKLTVGSYDDSSIRRRIEAKFDLHHPAPISRWRWLRAGEVCSLLYGEAGEEVKGFRDRVGRVLSTIAREYPQVEKKYANGRSQYLLPPLT